MAYAGVRAIRRLSGFIPLCLAGLVASAAFAAPQNLDEAMSYDGLQKISVKGIDLAYAVPGATLAGYTKVLIDPVGVAFHKDWKPTTPGSRRGLSSDEQQRIRADVAKIVQEEFVAELKKGGYAVVDAAGPDVLRVQANIVNLYVTAPDVMTPGRTRVYTANAGEMTLLAQLSDSDSGEVIARVIDRYQARSTATFQLSSSVGNASEARNAASMWARILRGALDKAKSIGAP